MRSGGIAFEKALNTHKDSEWDEECEIFIALNEYCLDAMRQCSIVIRRISHEEELIQMRRITESK